MPLAVSAVLRLGDNQATLFFILDCLSSDIIVYPPYYLFIHAARPSSGREPHAQLEGGGKPLNCLFSDATVGKGLILLESWVGNMV